jgi:hypothetical protein
MALPILESPKYTVEIPSTKKAIEYRPFLVKEEKILLMAQESQDSREMLNAMKDIIRACTFEKVDVNALTSFDLEYVFLKLRSKSVGEISNVNVKCSSCEAPNPIAINLDEITVKFDDSVSKTIMITDTVGVNMRYIRVKDMSALTDDKKTQSDLINEVVIASIESIFDAEKVYPAENSSKEELIVFINSLSRAQMQKIESFISAVPALKQTVQFKCKACAHDNSLELTGTQAFFD